MGYEPNYLLLNLSKNQNLTQSGSMLILAGYRYFFFEFLLRRFSRKIWQDFIAGGLFLVPLLWLCHVNSNIILQEPALAVLLH